MWVGGEVQLVGGMILVDGWMDGWAALCVRGVTIQHRIMRNVIGEKAPSVEGKMTTGLLSPMAAFNGHWQATVGPISAPLSGPRSSSSGCAF